MAVGGGGGVSGGAERRSTTHMHDLPDAILVTVLAMVTDVRSRNSIALVCAKWRSVERSTRTSLSLRGNVRDLFLLPTCFPSVSRLDLSLLSPWGHSPSSSSAAPAAVDDDHHLIAARRLRQAFPNLAALTLYARAPSPLAAQWPALRSAAVADDDHHLLAARRLRQAFPNLAALTLYARAPSPLAAQWPALRSAALVRYHQRPHHLPLGADLAPLLAACTHLSSLDLSRFYCWPEDLPPALAASPAAANSLTHLDLLNPAASDGFRSSELLAVANSCPNLIRFLAPCVFNPRYIDYVGDPALLALAAACSQLSQLHLADPAALSSTRNDNPDNEAGITRSGLEGLFAGLSYLEHLAIDLRHSFRNASGALEFLGSRCPRLRSLELGCFHGVCPAAGLHLDGVAVCGRLESLCLKDCPDLTDAGLIAIARGCRRLAKLKIHGCPSITEIGIRKLAGMLRKTLADVSISGCRNFDAGVSIRALEPIRDRIERLHIDCVWVRPNLQPETRERNVDDDMVHDEFEQEMQLDCSSPRSKKCKYADCAELDERNRTGFWFRVWDRLRYLSLWVPAGELLSPLPDAGLQICPNLEEVSIKVEGDCRTCPRPSQQVFGLSSLAQYPRVSKMKLDCSEAIGYALTAPSGQMDLSLWERFYLHGIGELNLYELDYWPPQDKEVNQRSLSLPATSLIQGCLTLRKLFIHGTTHEHFLRFFLEMPRLRDVQLREDYYPAPENEMSTEMRVGSCSRFEDALNSRRIPD